MDFRPIFFGLLWVSWTRLGCGAFGSHSACHLGQAYEIISLRGKFVWRAFKRKILHNRSSLLSLQINTFFFPLLLLLLWAEERNFSSLFMNQIKVSLLEAQGEEKLIFCVNRACSFPSEQFLCFWFSTALGDSLRDFFFPFSVCFHLSYGNRQFGKAFFT